MGRHSCDCSYREKEVCDICQGVKTGNGDVISRLYEHRDITTRKWEAVYEEKCKEVAQLKKELSDADGIITGLGDACEMLREEVEQLKTESEKLAGVLDYDPFEVSRENKKLKDELFLTEASLDNTISENQILLSLVREASSFLSLGFIENGVLGRWLEKAKELLG